MAQFELLIRCMHFDTIRRQVHIWYHQFKIWSETRLVKNLNLKYLFFSIFWLLTVIPIVLQGANIVSNPNTCLLILYFLGASSIILLFYYFPQFPSFCSKEFWVPNCSMFFESVQNPIISLGSTTKNRKKPNQRKVSPLRFTGQFRILYTCYWDFHNFSGFHH